MIEMDKLFREPGPSGKVHKFREVYLMAAALLIDMAHVDGQVVFQEREAILRVLQKKFDINLKAAKALADYAEGLRGTAADMFHATMEVKMHLNERETKLLVRMLLEVMIADGKVHRQEETFIHGVCQLLGVSHATLDELTTDVRKKLLHD